MIELHLYRIEVSTSEFVRIDTITTHQNLQWFTKLNGIGACRFQVSLWDRKATTANLRRWRTNVAVVENNEIIFFGPISKLDVSYNNVGGNWNVECLSYFAHLRSRFVNTLTQEDGTDAGNIAWNLIDTAQSRTNGELMIDEGDIETTVNRDRTYEIGANVAEKIIALTKILNGFDFDLRYNYASDNKLDNIFFDVFANRGSVRNDLPTLKVGENVKDFQATTQDDIINTIDSLGAGTGDGRNSYSTSDGTSQQDYTRRERIITFQDITVQETLEENTDEILTRNKVERYHINVELMPDTVPLFGTYILGDSLKYDLKAVDETGREAVSFKGTAQVIEIGVNLDREGVKHIIPKLEVTI